LCDGYDNIQQIYIKLFKRVLNHKNVLLGKREALSLLHFFVAE
jgi:hypothetical protein